MKKILLSMLALVLCMGNAFATKTFANFGVPAGNGSWDADAQTYTWTAGWSNLMPIFTFPAGELAEYTSLHLTTSGYTEDGAYRVCFMTGSTAVATIAFYSAGEKNLVLAERSETKDLDLSAITAIQFGGASGAGSIGLDPASVYLVKPLSLQFGEDGKAHITASDLDATGNVSVNALTGEITSTGTGSFSVSLPNADFSAVSRVDVTRSGDDICNTMAINDAVNGNVNTWYGSKYGCDFTSYQSKAGQVNKITWNVDKAGTMTVSDIVITASVLKANDPHLVDVTSLPYKNWDGVGADATVVGPAYPANELGKAMGQGSTIFGDGNVSSLNYVDLTGYSALKVKASAGAQVRICMNRAAGNGTVNVDVTKTVQSDGYATFDLTAYAYSHLHAIKFPWNGQTHTVFSIEAVNEDAPVDYILSGAGVLTSGFAAALADASATSYDATGLTGAADLAPANHNAVIYASAGASATASAGILVKGTTAAAATFSEGFDVNIPTAFTATAATYTRTLPASGWSTAIIPFDCEVPEGVTAYSATVVGGEVQCTKLDAIVANEPIVIKGTGDVVFTASDAAVAATPASLVSNDLTGNYKSQKAPVDSYVLQGGMFKKVVLGSEPTIGAFRAYLTTASAASELRVSIIDDEDVPGLQTGVSKVTVAAEAEVYDILGRRVSQMKPGHIYVSGGKKVVR